MSNGVLVIRCAQWKLRRQTTRVGGGLAYRCWMLRENWFLKF